MKMNPKFQLVAEDAASPAPVDQARDLPAERSAEGRARPGKPRKRAGIDSTLADSELRFRRLFETARDGILILDAETGRITEANPFLQDLLGYSHEELLGRTLWEIGPFRDALASRQAFRRLQTWGYVRYDNLPLETRDHQRRQVEFVSNVYKVDGTRVIQCNIRDITERRADEDRARRINQDLLSLVETLGEQANHDPLTGLFNRRYLDDSLPRELSLSQRRRVPLSVAMLDIDHFKKINDTFGHEAGDLALRECARVLSQHLRRGDIACRLGGEEFALVLPDSSLADTLQRVEQICALIKRLEIRHDGQLLDTLTLSAGIAGSPEHAATARELLSAADTALYEAKRAGRAKVILFPPIG